MRFGLLREGDRVRRLGAVRGRLGYVARGRLDWPRRRRSPGHTRRCWSAAGRAARRRPARCHRLVRDCTARLAGRARPMSAARRLSEDKHRRFSSAAQPRRPKARRLCLSEDKTKKIRSPGEAKSLKGSKARWLLATIASLSFPGLAAVGAIVVRRRLLSRPLQPVRSEELLREDGGRAGATFLPGGACAAVSRRQPAFTGVSQRRCRCGTGVEEVPVSVTRALSAMGGTFRGSACWTG